MKRVYYLILALILFGPQIVLAAPNATIGVSASSIEKGQSVTATVTITDSAAWNIRITGSGAASCTQKFADVTADAQSTTKKLSLKCTSTTDGTIHFSVTGDITSGAGQTKNVSLSKDVTVNKAKSSVNTLSDLKVNGKTVSGFSSSKTSYTLGEESGSSITIAATPTDSKAKVSGTGTKSLGYGKNAFTITVTAENGAKKTYSITISRADSRSKNNYLKSLSVDKGTISFNKNTTSYLIKVEHDVENVTIKAQAEDSKAQVSGTGTKKLADYVNEFKVVVTAENKTTRTYVVKVARKDKDGNFGKLSSDNIAKSITITDYKFVFDNNVKKYNLLVEEEVNELEFNVVPNNSNATVSVANNTDLKPGLNEVTVTVTAENGDKNEFLFNIYKIGETKTCEVEEESKEDNILSKINVWMIVSGVELIVIISLIAKVASKKKNKKKK